SPAVPQGSPTDAAAPARRGRALGPPNPRSSSGTRGGPASADGVAGAAVASAPVASALVAGAATTGVASPVATRLSTPVTARVRRVWVRTGSLRHSGRGPGPGLMSARRPRRRPADHTHPDTQYRYIHGL